jgi:uncharacterized protein (TIGR00369 family)
MGLKLNAEEVMVYLDEVFPQMRGHFAIDELRETGIVVRLQTKDEHLRPGGTVSGPSMFGLVDVAMYMLVLARIGREALAVTTNCSIDFMRKPVAGQAVIAECRLLKLGRSLAVGDALVFSDGDGRPVARASLTYSIPPKG